MMNIRNYLFIGFLALFSFSPLVSSASCIVPEGGNLDELFSSKNLAIGVYEKKEEDGKTSYHLYLGNEFAPFSLKEDFCPSEFSQLDGENGYILLAQKEDASMRYLQAISEKQDAVNRFTEVSNMYEGLQSGSIDTITLKEDVFYQKPGMTLRPGMVDEKVKELQKALKKKLNLDESFKIDGKYGPATVRAVKRLQQIIGIKEDGIAGEKTLNALVGVVIGKRDLNEKSDDIGENKEKNPSLGEKVIFTLPTKIVRPGAKGNEVKQIQEVLKKVLKLDESFKVDGKYGPATTRAVKRLQKELSLKEDGIFGPLTREAFFKKYGNQAPVDNSFEESQNNNNSSSAKESSQQEQGGTQVDNELKALLLRAKNELIHFGKKGNSFSNVSAYEKVIRYNNDLLRASSDSDPLYLSLDGGKGFIYTAKTSEGKYLCVDSNKENTLKELDERPTGESAGCELL